MTAIAIRVRKIAQLVNVMDPAPLASRALNGDVERYLIDGAARAGSTEQLLLFIHVPESLRKNSLAMTDAIHEHFRRAHTEGERAFRRRLRIGSLTLIVALVVLAGSLLLRSLLTRLGGTALAQGFGEGLLILGWVAMWRPVEILLFEHWESHLDHSTLERLASVRITFVFRPDPVRAQRGRVALPDTSEPTGARDG